MKSLIITGGNINKEFLQDFLKENRDSFPELNCCGAPTLDSSASSQLFLGGRRGRKLI